MDHGENSNLTRGSASRPPQGSAGAEDIPLFTEADPPAPRRAPSYGRPESAPPRSGTGSAARTGSPYGGREYTSSGSRGGGRARQTQSRQAPVYTELNWNDLRSGADLGQAGRQTPTPSPDSVRPQGGGGSYFGGFSQEMEEQYYGQPDRGQPGYPRSNYTQTGYTQAGRSAPAGRSPAGGDPRVTRYGAAQPRQEGGRQAPPRQNGGVYTQPPRQSGAGGNVYTPQGGTYVPPVRQSQSPPPRRQAVPRQSAAPRQGYVPPNRQPPGQQSPMWRAPAPQNGRGPAPIRGNGHVQYTGRPRQQGLNPLVYVGGFALLALVIFLVARLAGSSGQNRVPATARPTVDPGVAITSVPSMDPNGGDVTAVGAETSPGTSPETTPDVTPTPSPEPTATPSGPKAEQLGNLIVPADWGPVVPERNTEVYDSHFEKTVMIGNSLVEGFFMWSGLKMKCIYDTGATIDKVLGIMDLSPLTLNAPGYYTDIYLMFGLNEVGTDVNNFVQNYKKVVDFIREYQPDANIYVISVTPVMDWVDKDPGEVQSMERVDRFNAALKEFCVDQHCWYLDIYTMLLDGQGFLSTEYGYAGDGKHLEKSGYVAWANYMKTHYVDAGLLTE